MAILYVDAQATGLNNGTSWANAYNQIYTAVDNASQGDEIWVAKSTNQINTWYLPGTGILDYIDVKVNISLYGGFTPGATDRSQRNLDQKTTIHGSFNSYYFLMRISSASSEEVEINNFNFFNGGFYSVSPVRAIPSGGKITIKNCFFDSNRGNNGGAIAATNTGEVHIENCFFLDNTTNGTSYSNGNGGAIEKTGASLNIYVRNCLFIGNNGDRNGGALYTERPAVIENCVFKENSSGYNGGAIYYKDYVSDNDIINHCVFFNNQSGTSAGTGTVYLSGLGLESKLQNSIFWNNTTSDPNGNNIYAEKVYASSANLRLSSLDIDGGTGNSSVFIQDSGVTYGTIFNTDPLFRDSSKYGFDLTDSSPLKGEANDSLDIGIIGNDTFLFTFDPIIYNADPGETSFVTTATSSGKYKFGYEYEYEWVVDSVTKVTPSPSYTLNVPGLYNASLSSKVADFGVVFCGFESAYIYSDSTTKNNYIRANAAEPPPSVSITADPEEGTVPLSVDFTDSSTGTITSRVWSFHDGTTSVDLNVSKKYNDNDIFKVDLQVTGPGGTSSAEANINVKPNVDFNLSSSEISLGETVNFTDNSEVTICGWTWLWSDPNSEDDPYLQTIFAQSSFDQTAKNPNLDFSSPTFEPGKTYNIYLCAHGPTYDEDDLDNSNWDVTMKQVTILSNLSADFTFTPSTGKQPLTVSFTDTSTGGVDSHAWDFGDGDTSTLQDPSHTFIENGSYSVELTAIRTSPAYSDSVTKTVNVKPIAAFVATPVNGSVPLQVTFTDQSVTTITSWLWEFGDGTSSTDQNPTKTYYSIGTYTVSLTVSGPGGSDKLTKNSYISVTFSGDAYYVDLNKEDSGIGTQDNPLNYQDFSTKTYLGDDSFDYKIRGNIDLDSTIHNNYIGGLNINMLPWNLDDYGPWRIHTPSTGFSDYSVYAKKLSGAIIQTDMDTTYSDIVALNLFLCGTTIENSHIRSNDRCFLNVYGDSYFCGSNFIVSTDGNTIVNIDDLNDSDPVILSFKDCIIDARDIGVTGAEDKLSGSLLYTEDTAFNYGGVKRIGRLSGITGIHKSPQFDYDLPEPWPDWNAGAQGSTGMDDPEQWASWSTWGKMVRVGSDSYTDIPTGLFNNSRLGVGALYFDTSPIFSVNKTKNDFVNVLSSPLKTSNKFIAMGWIKYPSTSDNGVLYPLVISDPYGRVLEDNAASFKLAIKREGYDYRLQFSGSQSKLIKRSLSIDLRDNDWHFIAYACVNEEGLMKYYVDGIVLPSDTSLNSDGFSNNISRSEHVRLGGGDVYSPYLYQAGTAIALYNWRVGFNFCIHQEWIQDLINIDKENLGIS